MMIAQSVTIEGKEMEKGYSGIEKGERQKERWSQSRLYIKEETLLH